MIFRHRRLFCLSLFAVLSVFVAEHLPHDVKGTAFWALLALAFVFLCLGAWKRRFLVFVIALLLSATACLSSYQISYKKDAVAPLAEEATDMTVTVHTPLGKYKNGYLADGRLSLLVDGKWLSLPVKVHSPIAVAVGDVLFGEADFTPTEADSYQATQGIYGTVKYLDECKRVDRLSSPMLSLSKLREDIAKHIRSRMPNENGELLCALLIGVRDGLPDTFTRDMGRIGTAHMLSLSGMHLVVLTTGIALILKRLRLGKQWRVLLLSAFAVFFMLLTGLSSSVLRAGFMLLFSSLPLFMREERDSLSSLTAAVAVILLWEPYALWDIALWLSALSTLGILFFFDRRKWAEGGAPSPRRRILGYISLSLSVTLAATLATLPLTLCTFGRLPLLSPLANLLLSPLVQVALYLSVAVVFLGGIPLVSTVTSFVCKAVFALSDALADIPRTVLTFKSPTSLVLVFLLFALLLTYFAFVSRRRFSFRVPVALCLLFSLLLSGTEVYARLSHHGELSVSYYSAEWRESDALLFTYRGERLLAVFSDFSRIFSAEEDALASVGDELDGFLLPYYTKHAGDYVKALLERKKVFCLYLPTPQTESEKTMYTEILSVAAKEEARIVTTNPQTPFFFGTLTASPIFLDKKRHTASYEFLFGYSRIQYYGGNTLKFGNAPHAQRADAVIFGSYGGRPRYIYSREAFIAPNAHVLCGDTDSFPFSDPRGIVFARTGTVYIPMETSHS